jgi:hypothetical protein
MKIQKVIGMGVGSKETLSSTEAKRELLFNSCIQGWGDCKVLEEKWVWAKEFKREKKWRFFIH